MGCQWDKSVLKIHLCLFLPNSHTHLHSAHTHIKFRRKWRSGWIAHAIRLCDHNPVVIAAFSLKVFAWNICGPRESRESTLAFLHVKLCSWACMATSAHANGAAQPETCSSKIKWEVQELDGPLYRTICSSNLTHLSMQILSCFISQWRHNGNTDIIMHLKYWQYLQQIGKSQLVFIFWRRKKVLAFHVWGTQHTASPSKLNELREAQPAARRIQSKEI